ncbi:MAG: nucleotidyltransferase domain-containing protein, partial [Nodosilinea sp.]
MAAAQIELPTEQISEFCDRWLVTEFSLFGSVLRSDFHGDSDIDVLVKFHPEAHPTFHTLDQMEAELELLFSRNVDLITRQGIESSLNYLRRREILSSAQVIYAAGSSIQHFGQFLEANGRMRVSALLLGGLANEKSRVSAPARKSVR